jgi:hypothetical protein
VNLLSYLAYQLLRGCQSADNQCQALQNQEIEDLLVHGSRTMFLDFSGLAGFDTWRIYVPLFWATYRVFSSFLSIRILEHFLSVDIITLFTLVLMRH